MNIIKSVESISLGQEIGFSWSANHDIYRTIGKVVKISGNTIKLESQLNVRGYQKGHIFTYSFRKSTKSNNVFELSPEGIYEITKFNQVNEEVQQKVNAIINEYWETKIAKAEQEQKDQGVYKSGEVYEITGNGLVHKYNKMEISA